jgi:galactokinase/mevalonate kinase-like predicted kinase
MYVSFVLLPFLWGGGGLGYIIFLFSYNMQLQIQPPLTKEQKHIKMLVNVHGSTTNRASPHATVWHE